MVIEYRTKSEVAAELLRETFANQRRVLIVDVAAAGRELGVSRRTLSRAAREFGVREVHNGPYPAFWERPD